MFEISAINVDKFVHTFFQNLGLKLESPAYRNSNKITFINHVDKTRKMKRELLSVAEKLKDIAVQQNLDFSDEKSVRQFIEKHTNFLDKFIYSYDTQLLTSYLRNINRKIVQKVNAKQADATRKLEHKVSNKTEPWGRKVRLNLGNSNKYDGSKRSPCSTSRKENHFNVINLEKRKHRRTALLKNFKPDYHNSSMLKTDKCAPVLQVKQDIKKCHSKCSLKYDAIRYVQKEIEVADKFLWLCIKDVEFIKRNVHINLYIAKELNDSKRNISLVESDQVLLFCKQAILCLIEPSERAFVSFEDDLPMIINNYLLQGCEYHFDSQRDSERNYIALLILSHWAKVLVKHLNTTMMQTIRSILGCDSQTILTLSYMAE